MRYEMTLLTYGANYPLSDPANALRDGYRMGMTDMMRRRGNDAHPPT